MFGLSDLESQWITIGIDRIEVYNYLAGEKLLRGDRAPLRTLVEEGMSDLAPNPGQQSIEPRRSCRCCRIVERSKNAGNNGGQDVDGSDILCDLELGRGGRDDGVTAAFCVSDRDDGFGNDSRRFGADVDDRRLGD
ncbi:hypothetical protein [Mycolicibacterium gilvum]|uniref:hypothetical protein n=1 Tax=Mycolicibacterium gilvum TaxID=1804 RepID=UPI0011C021CE|nr:hypothetical protein [Mycolicibacterium gilvum]MCV7057876.1 hypothetical protein [Mycolicibacterium gilvum]